YPHGESALSCGLDMVSWMPFVVMGRASLTMFKTAISMTTFLKWQPAL
nr:hypothetical protein [Tanacetum cinerariifolium]